MNLNPYWYVGPWEWRTEDGESFWSPPIGCIGSIDLRSLPAQSVAGGAPQGMGLFLTNGVRLGSDYTLLGTGYHRDLKTDQRIRDAFPKRDRRRQPLGDDLLGVIYDALGDGSDPTGDDGPKPLMPSTRGNISICIGGITHSQWMKRGERHWGKCLDVIRRDFQRTFDDAQKGRLKDRDHHRRVLDALCDKYHAEEWQEFVPQAIRKHIPGRLKHETTYTESFNSGSASDTLGFDLTWNELTGDIDNGTNDAVNGGSGTGDSQARAEHDLSSDDHYVQINVTQIFSGRRCGVVARYTDGSNFYYGNSANAATATYQIAKRISGTPTAISSQNSTAVSTAIPAKLIVDGSSLDYESASTPRLSGTDTAITGSLRCGFGSFSSSASNNSRWDDFECADLAAAPGILLTQLESTTRGYMRGTWTRG